MLQINEYDDDDDDDDDDFRPHRVISHCSNISHIQNPSIVLSLSQIW